MSTQTLATADALLKDLYEGPIAEQINQKTFLLDEIQRDADKIDFTGRRAIVPLHKNRNRGRASTADGGNLPKAGKQEYVDAIVHMRYNYAGIELSDAAIKATKQSEGAFISLLQAESEGVAKDMRKEVQRQAFGTGDGLLATCGTTTASEVVKLENSFATQYLHIGDIVDIVVKSSGSVSTGTEAAEITAKSVANGTITIGTTKITTDNTFGVYLSGNRELEMDGLRNITAESRTLHEVNSASAGNSFWNGNVVEAGSSLSALSTASEDLFIQLADKIGEAGQGDCEIFLTTRGIRRRLANLYQSQKRMNDAKTVDIHGGYTAIMVDEIPVLKDDDCPKTWAFGFRKAVLAWYELTKPQFLRSEDNGSIFQLKNIGVGRSAAIWQAWYEWYAALGTNSARQTGAIKFCADDNPSEAYI